MMNGCNTIHMKDMSISIYVKNKSIGSWQINTFILFIQNQEYVGFCCLKIIRVQLYKLLYESYFTIPLYSFTMHSLRGTLSVGWADRFSLWVVLYVYDE